MATIKKPAKKTQMGGSTESTPMMKMGGSMKAKNGKKFPDLNKDGKITKADILKGRGVIAKKGASIKKKMQYGGKAASMVPKAKNGMHKMPDGSMMKNSKMQTGGKVGKCKNGC